MASSTAMKDLRRGARGAASRTHHTDLDNLSHKLKTGTADEAYDRLLQALAAVSADDLDAILTTTSEGPSAASAREAVRVTAWLVGSTRRKAADLLGVSESRVSRNDTIDRAMLDRLQALAHLFARVSRVIGIDGAAQWFKDPNPGLDGKAPVDLFNTSYGRSKVDGLVTALLFGDVV